MKIHTYILLSLICGVSLVSCGGGGSASDSPTSSIVTSSAVSVTSVLTAISSSSHSSVSSISARGPKGVGTIVDIWPEGLHYETTSGISGDVYIGDRDSDALEYPYPHFYYGERDNVVFSIGNLKLPNTLATRSVTLFDIFKTHKITNEIINYVRLLLTINSNSATQGGSALNHINVPEKYNDTTLDIYITLADLKLPTNDFEMSANVQKFLKTVQNTPTLVSKETAYTYVNKIMSSARLPCYQEYTSENVIGKYGDQCEDSDGDGVPNKNDAFPWDADESVDLNGDGIGDSQNRTHTDLLVPNANNLLFNNMLGQLYIYHKTTKSLSVIDVQSGALLKTLAIDDQLKCMTLSADGKFIYAGILNHEYNSDFYAKQSGTILVIDTSLLQEVNRFSVDIDPFDLVSISEDRLVISTGSGVWMAPKLYDAKSGFFLSSLSGDMIHAGSSLIYNRKQEMLYVRDVFGLFKYRFNGLNLAATSDSPLHIPIDNSDKMWITPDTNYFVSKSGTSYSVQNLMYEHKFSYWVADVTFDTDTNQAYVIDGEQVVSFFNLTTFEKSGQVGFNIYGGFASWGIFPGFEYDYLRLDNIYIYQDYLYILHIKMGGSLQLIKIPKPCLLCKQSSPPNSIFSVPASNINAFNTVTLDASLSTDAEDGSNLLYRWDIDGDGIWDTPFSSKTILQYKWITSGEKSIILQVKDSSGYTASLTQKVSIVSGLYKGAEPKSKIFSDLGIPISYVLQDKERAKAYVTSMYNQKMYIVDLITGLVVREFEFEIQPAKMIMTPDNKAVYVALVMGDNDTQWNEKDQRGVVLKFDTEQQAFVDGFDIKIDPYDMILNDLGQLAITHGSGQFGVFHLYDPITGKFIAEFGDDTQQQRFMIATQDILQYSYPDTKFKIAEYDNVYYMLMDDAYFAGDRSWVMPDGKILSYGQFIMNPVNQKIVAELETGDMRNKVSFDTDQNLMFQLASNGDINYFNLNTYEFVGSLPSIQKATWVIPQGDKINVFTQYSNFVSALTQLPHPCTLCGKSTEPIASFNFSQNTADTAALIQLDASTSYDAEDDLSKLQYIWDFDNDGVWDTPFSTNPKISYRFRMLGEHTVKLKVKDSSGKTSIVSKAINITKQGVDLGVKMISGAPFSFDFKVTDAAVDQQAGVVYISDNEQRRLYVVNLITGVAEKHFDFFYRPEKLTISPDGKKLYVAVTLKENNQWLPLSEYNYISPYAFIAVVDLQKQAIVNYYKINTLPENLVAVNNNQLVISSNNVHLLDANTGVEMDDFSSPYINFSPLQFYPTNNLLYLTKGLSNAPITKIEILNGKFNFISMSDISSQYNIGQNQWLTPDGAYIITKAGDVFDANTFKFVTRLSKNGGYIAQLVFDIAKKQIIVIFESRQGIEIYSLSNWSQLQSFPDNANARFIVHYQTKNYVLNMQNNTLMMKEL